MLISDIITDGRNWVSRQLTSSEYSDADALANANRWYRTLIAWALLAGGEWEVQGDTASIDFPVGGIIPIPNNLFSMERVEVLYPNSTSFVIAHPQRPADQMRVPEANSTRSIDDPSAPTFDLLGDKMIIRPGPDSLVTNGVKVWLTRDIVDLDLNTYKEPQLMEPVKRGLSIGLAMDYCVGEEMWSKYNVLKRMMFGDPQVLDDAGIKGLITDLYSMRADVRSHGLKARRRSYR